MRAYEPSKAQQTILKSLQKEIRTHAGAEDYFAEIGIVVKPVRVERTSEPRVTIKSRFDSSLGEDGVSDRVYRDLTDEEVAALEPWLTK